LKIRINSVKDAPRDPKPLEALLKQKQKECDDKARHVLDTERLVAEIEMLKVLLYLVNRNNRRS
jgi:hypothetical protein